MGYTHYIIRLDKLNHNPKTWKEFIEDVKKLSKNLPKHSNGSGGYHSKDPLEIAGGDGTGLPIFDENLISFNGKGDELRHETLYIEREPDLSSYKQDTWDREQEFFSCCKTDQKPYDLMVQGVLILYKHHFEEQVSIRSDGWHDDWMYAFKLIKDLFGYRSNLKFEPQPKTSS